MASSTSSMPRPVLALIGRSRRRRRCRSRPRSAPCALGLGGGQVDLVEDRDDLVVGVDRLVEVGQRLRLDALAASTTSSAPSQAASERDTS
jgi:hypothetical protein